MQQKLDFRVEMTELRRAVNLVRNGLGQSKTDLGVMLFRVTVTGQKCALFASDKEVVVRGVLDIKNPDQKDGSFAVLGTKLVQLISQVDSEMVRVSVDAENIEVVAGFLTVNFEVYDDSGLRAVEQTLVEECDSLSANFLALPRAALEEGLVCAKSCTTVNSIRPDLTHVEVRSGRILSSDGRKILILSHDAIPKAMELKVPSVALNSAIGAIKNTDSEALGVAAGKSYYFITSPKGMLCVRRIERTFPQVEQMIVSTEAATDEISVDKLVLESMVKGVALGLQVDDVKVTIDIVGEGSEAYMEVSTINALGRRSHECASCGRQQKEPLSLPVSFKHLLDTLGVFKGDSVVDMLIMAKRNILLIRDTTSDREVLTVIPFRTQAAIDQEKKEAAEKAEKSANPPATPESKEASGSEGTVGDALEDSATHVDETAAAEEQGDAVLEEV